MNRKMFFKSLFYVFAASCSLRYSDNNNIVVMEEQLTMLKNNNNLDIENASIIHNLVKLSENSGEHAKTISWCRAFALLKQKCLEGGSLSSKEIEDLNIYEKESYNCAKHSAINILLDVINSGKISRSRDILKLIDNLSDMKGTNNAELIDAIKLCEEHSRNYRTNKLINRIYALNSRHDDTALAVLIVQLNALLINFKYQDNNITMYDSILALCRRLDEEADKMISRRLCQYHNVASCEKCNKTFNRAKEFVCYSRKVAKECRAKGLYMIAKFFRDTKKYTSAIKICDLIISKYNNTKASNFALMLKKELSY